MAKHRIRKKYTHTLADATAKILADKPNQGRAIDEAVKSYFTPIVTNGKFHEKK